MNLVRYADDFIISGRDPQKLLEIQAFVSGFLAERGLELSAEKTHLTHIDEGFDFLGQNVRRYNGKLVIQPAKKNRQAFLDKVRAVIKANPTLSAGRLIQMLNPLIRGWANYHRHVCSKRTYRYTDFAIFKALWRWARRRHPKIKNGHWVRKKYFHTHQRRTWTFSGEVKGRDGKLRPVYLLYATNTRIQYHTKIRAKANPFDPQWEVYFEKRIQERMRFHLNSWLLQIWRNQHGRCPACQQLITLESGWHAHHIVWRSHGGSNQPSNIELLHPGCHWQLHAHRLKVVEPRPAAGV